MKIYFRQAGFCNDINSMFIDKGELNLCLSKFKIKEYILTYDNGEFLKDASSDKDLKLRLDVARDIFSTPEEVEKFLQF